MKDKFQTGAIKAHQLTEVWNDYPEILQNKKIKLPVPKIEDFIGGMFAPGEFYYYTINFHDSSISGVHQNILKIHRLDNIPHNLKDIIDLIHPEDLEFVMKAERMAIEKMYEIGWENQKELNLATVLEWIQEMAVMKCFTIKRFILIETKEEIYFRQLTFILMFNILLKKTRTQL